MPFLRLTSFMSHNVVRVSPIDIQFAKPLIALTATPAILLATLTATYLATTKATLKIFLFDS